MEITGQHYFVHAFPGEILIIVSSSPECILGFLYPNDAYARCFLALNAFNKKMLQLRSRY